MAHKGRFGLGEDIDGEAALLPERGQGGPARGGRRGRLREGGGPRARVDRGAPRPTFDAPNARGHWPGRGTGADAARTLD
eukprot:8300679-Pyramimonas_sp.AAC.1